MAIFIDKNMHFFLLDNDLKKHKSRVTKITTISGKIVLAKCEEYWYLMHALLINSDPVVNSKRKIFESPITELPTTVHDPIIVNDTKKQTNIVKYPQQTNSESDSE